MFDATQRAPPQFLHLSHITETPPLFHDGEQHSDRDGCIFHATASEDREPFQQLKQTELITPSYFAESYGLSEHERVCWIKQLLSETPLTEEQLGELFVLSLKGEK